MNKEELMQKYGITPTWWEIMELTAPPGVDILKYAEERMKNPPKGTVRHDTLCGGHLRAKPDTDAKDNRR